MKDNMNAFVHGHRKGNAITSEYNAWRSMRQRCRYDHCRYHQGRGIKVCERWNNFTNFFADMGPKPTPQHQLDRINNDGDYTPTNCRWVTPTEQANNRRKRKSKYV